MKYVLKPLKVGLMVLGSLTVAGYVMQKMETVDGKPKHKMKPRKPNYWTYEFSTQEECYSFIRYILNLHKEKGVVTAEDLVYYHQWHNLDPNKINIVETSNGFAVEMPECN